MGIQSTASIFGGLLLAASGATAQEMEFVDVTWGSGLDVSLGIVGPGTAVGDYDRDGWLDVCITGIGVGRGPRIFRNLGGERNGSGPWFEDVSSSVMPADFEPGSVSIFGDLDNDGDLDLITSRRFRTAQHPTGDVHEIGLMYYENVGARYIRGRSDISLGWAPNSVHGGLTLGDVDLDGDLDIVFVHGGGGNGVGGPGFYIRNDGLPDLVDDTQHFGANLDQVNRYFSVILADFNGDLRLDLHGAVDFYQDYHASNDGIGNFTYTTQSAGTTNTGSDMGLAIGDMDNDGDLDLYSTNINQGVLYVNNGDDTFQDEAYARGCASWDSGFGTIIGWGTSFADFDNDRDLDLLFVARSKPGHLFRNLGGGNFARYTNAGGLQDRLGGHGLVVFDYDRDGDEDFLVMRSGVLQPGLYENTTERAGRHWLSVELEGTRSNRDGVGARIELHTPDGERLTRVITAGSSFKSGPPMNAHFGLGDAVRARQIRVFWPSGVIQTLRGVAVDRVLRIVEP
ncbi:MAG: hypothetical protein ACI8QZ_001403 [Chlamydiales bacterium]|jgi:hypothetical protein